MTNHIKEMTNEELYERYSDHVAKNCRIAQSKYYWIISLEEAIQVAWSALIVMMQNYEPRPDSTEESFLGYSGKRIKGAILDEVRIRGGMKTTKDKEFYTVRKFELAIEELAEDSLTPAGLQVVDPEEPEKSLEVILNPLKDSRQKEVMRGLYQYDKTLFEVASYMDVSESRIHQIHKQALAKLRRFHVESRYAA